MIHAPPAYHPTRSALVRVGAPRFGFSARFFWVCLVGALGWVSSGARAADTPTVRGRGYSYVHQKLSEGPWSIHIFDIDRSNSDLEFHSTLGHGNTFGLSTVSEQVKTVPVDLGKPLVAINGDLFHRSQYYQGRPRGLQIRQGELVCGPEGHACFWIDPAGQPQMTNVESRFRVIWPDGRNTPIGLNEERDSRSAVLYTSVVGASTRTRSGVELLLEPATNSAWLPLKVGQVYAARVRKVRTSGDTLIPRDTMVLSIGSSLASRVPQVQVGATVQIATETIPDLTGVKMAISGGPTLVQNGRAERWTGFQLRHPRTVIGWNKEHIFLVEIDGRQIGLSVGMTFTELSGYLVKLGCEQAMNLDGGGSATFWMLGEVVSSPCEGRERPSANALVVVHKKTPLKEAKQ